MKVIELEQRGYVWQIPLEFVAQNRANHYEEENSKDWIQEIAWVMDDDYEAVDWFRNNMDWIDVADVAKLVKRPANPEEPDFMEDCPMMITEVKDESTNT